MQFMEQKKKYEQPCIEIIEMNNQDIIITSGGENPLGENETPIINTSTYIIDP